MNKVKLFALLAIPAMFTVGCSEDQDIAPSATLGASSNSEIKEVTGNGGPSGAHYNLNIIGVPHDKTADMTDNNGGRIFVSLNSNGSPDRIMLTPAPVGESFQVLDANGTDGRAEFQLPKDVAANWNVFARVPGNSGGSATITTCAEYTWDGTEVDISLCSSVTMDRQNYGKFTNVSDDLLYVTLSDDILNENGEVVVEAGKYPLFADELEGYFWEYNNSGLKLLQLRFFAQN